jgi:RNA polymerase sigma-70 factor (ECF subfamily)
MRYNVESLYQQNHARLRAIIQARIGWRRVDVEDVLQDAWLTAITRLDMVREPDRVDRWLTRVAINATKMWLRRERLRQGVDPGPHGPAVVANPSCPNLEGGMDVRAGLAGLPEGERTVLLWHDLWGLSHAEIASRLTLHRLTSVRRLQRARERMRRWLSPADTCTRPQSDRGLEAYVGGRQKRR